MSERYIDIDKERVNYEGEHVIETPIDFVTLGE